MVARGRSKTRSRVGGGGDARVESITIGRWREKQLVECIHIFFHASAPDSSGSAVLAVPLHRGSRFSPLTTVDQQRLGAPGDAVQIRFTT